MTGRKHLAVTYGKPYSAIQHGVPCTVVDVHRASDDTVVGTGYGANETLAMDNAIHLANCLWEIEPRDRGPRICHGVATHSNQRIVDQAKKFAHNWCGMCQDWFESDRHG